MMKPAFAIHAVALVLISLFLLGASIAQVGLIFDLVAPYCTERPTAGGVTELCKPCTLYGSAFGAIEFSTCPNPVITAITTYGVAWPHAIVVVGAVVLYPLLAPFRESLGDHAYILFALPLAFLAHAIVRNFIHNRRPLRGAYMVAIGVAALLVTHILVAL